MSKEDTTLIWLQNKLGSTTHLWSFSSTVVSQYTIEKLKVIRDNFVTLDSLVKLKFFLSLFYIPRRNMEEFHWVIQEIIDNTIQTCLDQWILCIALFVQSYWQSLSLRTDVDYDSEPFQDAYADLKTKLVEFLDSDFDLHRIKSLLPIECDYLNKNARFYSFQNSANLNYLSNELNKLSATHSGDQSNMELTMPNIDNVHSSINDLLNPNPSQNVMTNEQSSIKKHFNLVKKPKSMCSTEDLKARVTYASKSKHTKLLFNENNLNSISSDSSDYGISKSSPYLSRFSSGAKRNEQLTGGLNDNKSVLDLSSNGTPNSKGFLNQTGSFLKRSSFTATNVSITGKSSTTFKKDVGIKLLDVQEQSATPKEAKRKRKEQEKELMKKQKMEQQQSEKLEKEKLKTNIQIVQNVTHQQNQMPQSSSLASNSSMSDNERLMNTSNNDMFELNERTPQKSSIEYDMLREGVSTSIHQHHQQQHSSMFKITDFTTNSKSPFQQSQPSNQLQQSPFDSSSGSISSLRDFPLSNNNPQQPQQFPSLNQPSNQFISPNNEAFPTTSQFRSSLSASLTSPTTLTTLNQEQNEISRPAIQQQSLSLTREQMLQAQEMFSTSNRLTRPEKALILGFIAGSRDNPQPENGPLLSIKLSENEELLQLPNGHTQKIICEIFFQMNYETGEYKKIKKLRHNV